MPLQMNKVTPFQQMLFMTLSRDFPNMPISWTPGDIEHNLISEIQILFDNIKGQPLNTYDASWDLDWPSSDAMGWHADTTILAERVTEDETCLIVFRIVNDEDVFTKYLINMKTNEIKRWDGLPWSETHQRLQSHVS